jgi:DNA-binding MarR family transcriptional regulator
MDPTLPFAELKACFAMRAARLERRITRLFDSALGKAGLTVRQFNLLAQAAYAPGLSVQALAARTEVDPTTLTRNLKPLIANGWLTLNRDDADARLRRIILTDAGRAKLDDGLELWRAAQAAAAAAFGAQTPTIADALDQAARALKATHQSSA